jgi:hypothetical protein
MNRVKAESKHTGTEYVFRIKVFDDDDNGDDSLHGWGIKILT